MRDHAVKPLSHVRSRFVHYLFTTMSEMLPFEFETYPPRWFQMPIQHPKCQFTATSKMVSFFFASLAHIHPICSQHKFTHFVVEIQRGIHIQPLWKLPVFWCNFHSQISRNPKMLIFSGLDNTAWGKSRASLRGLSQASCCHVAMLKTYIYIYSHYIVCIGRCIINVCLWLLMCVRMQQINSNVSIIELIYILRRELHPKEICSNHVLQAPAEKYYACLEPKSTSSCCWMTYLWCMATQPFG